jgi:excisionase family DNA binding protein
LTHLFSPKQVAEAIGVSESSLKRWVDRGLIRTRLSPGGHRRLELNAVMEFLQSHPYPLADPGVLGLPVGLAARKVSLAEAREELYQAFAAGDEVTARRLLLGLHLAQRRISELGDELIAPVFDRIGSDWMCGSLEVYEERRACVACRRLLDEFRQLLPAPSQAAPVAIGFTPAGDQYDLAAQLVALTLQQRGWNAQLLGENVPLASAAEAVRRTQPKLIWLSVSHIVDEERFSADYHDFYEQVRPYGPVVLGGRALTAELCSALASALCCNKLSSLESYLEHCESDPARRKTA